MPTPQTLSTAPLEHPAMDYAFLRQEGLRHLERLAGALWTDFNAHDPGVTILEQLCYALTDLAYRINYELKDLLASGDQKRSLCLYSPAEILTTNPVTLTDLRKLVIDVDGVNNAWIELVESTQPELFYDPSDYSLYLEAATHRRPMPLRGMYRVLIEADGSRSNDDVKGDVSQRLHAPRNLCEDFAEPTILKEQKITVNATVEVRSVEDPDRLLASIYHALANAIAPRIRFYSLAERLAQGKSIDDIMDGPVLQHGFIDSDELEGYERKAGLRISDLIQVIMNVDGVSAVHNISLVSGSTTESWHLKLDPDCTPVLAMENVKTIQLVQKGVPAQHDTAQVKRIFADLRQADRPGPLPETERDIPLPVGRDRAVGNYFSFQHQFPATYGIGAMCLPESATPQRKAQANQLKAYLLLFDQLLANAFAQLAHVDDLFSCDPSSQTYFSQLIDDPTLGLDGIWTDPGERNKTLQQITEDPSTPDYARKHRFLNHVLVRFGEEFTDYSLEQKRLINAKCAFLREYRTLGAARGRAFNVTLPSWGADNVSGLEQRISRKLGLSSYPRRELKDLLSDDEGGFYLLEHILLRPREADTTPDAKGEGWQAGAVSALSPIQAADPYSLQLTFIFPDWIEGFNKPESQDFIWQIVREETPAHINIHLQWLNSKDMGAFESAYKVWLVEAMKDAQTIATRAARDRLVDLMEMGTPYPLRDLEIGYDAMVPPQEPAAITLVGAQPGVRYQLCDEDGNPVPDVNTATVSGDSSMDLTLHTPPVTQDISYTILASRTATAGGMKLPTPLDTYLSHIISVEMGINTQLNLGFVSGENQVNTEITIDYNDGIKKVKIEKSQAGISYVLVKDHPEAEPEGAPLSNPVQGNSINPIELLSSEKFAEDTVIRVKAYRTEEPTVMDYLTTTLSVKVRPNPAVGVEVAPSIVDYTKSVTLTLTNAQASADYQLFTRELVPADYGLPVADDPNLVAERMTNWDGPAGLTLAGSFVATGGQLSVPIPNMREDTLCVVTATKRDNHESLRLTQAVVVLVKPNPAPQVGVLQSPVVQNAIGTVTVTGTQKGVSYQLRLEDGAPINPPGYHYEDRGVDTSRLEVDFVVEAPADPTDYRTLKLPTEPITAQTTFHVLATKVLTGVTAELRGTATITVQS